MKLVEKVAHSFLKRADDLRIQKYLQAYRSGKEDALEEAIRLADKFGQHEMVMSFLEGLDRADKLDKKGQQSMWDLSEKMDRYPAVDHFSIKFFKGKLPKVEVQDYWREDGEQKVKTEKMSIRDFLKMKGERGAGRAWDVPEGPVYEMWDSAYYSREDEAKEGYLLDTSGVKEQQLFQWWESWHW